MDIIEFKKEFEKKETLENDNNVCSNPLVSVCIQTYQHVEYIKDCLDGILNQETNFTVEILLGEDDSTDGTREICIEYANRFPDKIRLFLHHRENNIAIGGRPTGRFNYLYNLFSARGKYIALCEGDDYWTDPLKLQKQVDFLEENEEYSACFTNATVVNEISGIEYPCVSEFKEGQIPFEKIVVHAGGLYPTAALLFRSKALKNLNVLLESGLAGDTLLIFHLGLNGKVFFMDSNTCVYRRWDGGLYSALTTDQEKLKIHRLKEIDGYRKLDRITNFKYTKSIGKRISLLYRKNFTFEPKVKNAKLFKYMIPIDIYLSIRFCGGLLAKKIGLK